MRASKTKPKASHQQQWAEVADDGEKPDKSVQAKSSTKKTFADVVSKKNANVANAVRATDNMNSVNNTTIRKKTKSNPIVSNKNNGNSTSILAGKPLPIQ